MYHARHRTHLGIVHVAEAHARGQREHGAEQALADDDGLALVGRAVPQQKVVHGGVDGARRSGAREARRAGWMAWAVRLRRRARQSGPWGAEFMLSLRRRRGPVTSATRKSAGGRSDQPVLLVAP